jgi:hypothetical protein
MQHVRRSVGDDVLGIVSTAKTLSDWRYYVQHHPWACLGAALVAGFLVVPKRKPPLGSDAKELLALLKKNNLHLGEAGLEPNKGMAKTLLAASVPVLMRSAMSLAGQHFLAGRPAAPERAPQPAEHPS